jgi:hypothetical protein
MLSPVVRLTVVLVFALTSNALLSLDAAEAKPPRAKVIYGQDNRLDYYQVSNANATRLANSTAMLVRANQVTLQGDQAQIATVPYGQSLGLCPSEPFYAQEKSGFCSGFLVAPDVMVTAGHCVRSQESCDSVQFVFGFQMNSAADVPKSVPAAQVYKCKQLLHSIAESSGEDFAVIRLDRAVAGVAPLSLRREGTLRQGEELLLIGYPWGLPLKVAGGGNVRAVKEKFFVGNLDAFKGNSGSAVFNASSGEVEGVLVRGEFDFVLKNGCSVSKICADDACQGEDVTRIDRVLPFIK